MSTMPSVGSGTYSPGPNMVCSSEQEKVGTGSREAIICPVYSNLRIRATVSLIAALSLSQAPQSVMMASAGCWSGVETLCRGSAKHMKLAGKVAIVGGASRGIGKDIAVAFAAEGAKVVVVARSEVEPDPRLPGTIHQTVAEIQAAGGEAIAVKADISDEAQVETMAKSALDTYGRIDILVNN